MITKLKKLIITDIRIDMYRLFSLATSIVDNPYAIAKDTHKIPIVTMNVATLFCSTSNLDNPIFAQITSSGSEAWEILI